MLKSTHCLTGLLEISYRVAQKQKVSLSIIVITLSILFIAYSTPVWGLYLTWHNTWHQSRGCTQCALTLDFMPPDLWPNLPDLRVNPDDYSFWSIMQEKVYQTHIASIDELKHRLVQVWFLWCSLTIQVGWRIIAFDDWEEPNLWSYEKEVKNKMNISSSVVFLFSSAPHVSAPPPPSAALKRAARNWAARKRAARDRDQTQSWTTDIAATIGQWRRCFNVWHECRTKAHRTKAHRVRAKAHICVWTRL